MANNNSNTMDWTAVASAAIGALGTVGSFLGNAGMTRKQMRYARELANKGMTNDQLQAFELSRQAAQEEREWNLQMDSTKYQRNVADMEAAGVNPALAMNGGISTQATSNNAPSADANGPQSALGVAPMDLSSVVDMALKAKQISNEYKLQNRALDLQERDISRKEKETQSVVDLNLSKKDYQEIINKYADESEQLKVDGQRKANDLTEETKKKVTQEIAESKERVNKLIEETKSEQERQKLIAAQTLLVSAQTKEIIELLPYKKALTAAQTSAAKAQAALATYNALIQKGLLDGGYVENTIAKMAADAGVAISKERIQEFLTEFKLGHLYDKNADDSWFEGKAKDTANFVLGGLFRALTGIMDYIPSLVNVAGN